MSIAKEGLRIVATYYCDHNCRFCYQKTKNSKFIDENILSNELKNFKDNNWNPIYITLQGGEITLFPNRLFKIASIVDNYYPHVYRKSVTSNGYAPLELYNELKLYGITHLSFSLHGKNKELENKFIKIKESGFYTVRINCFAHKSINELKYVYDFCKDNDIQLTFCEDLKNEIVKDVTNDITKNIVGHDDIEILKHKFQHVIIDHRNKYRFWIYKHLDSYDYNNWIILPSGRLTDNFDNVVNSKL